MKVGDIVRAKQHSIEEWCDKGIIMASTGPKWFKVAWADGIMQEEHIEDLELIDASR